MTDIIYAVYADHAYSRTLLGYATGNVEDIEAFFDSRKAYALVLVEVVSRHIPPGYAAKHNNLMARKQDLESELEQLNKELHND